MNALSLSRATLHSLDPRVAVPRYDPAAVTAGIVHLGLGGFHRAHMARYTHDLMNRDGDATRCTPSSPPTWPIRPGRTARSVPSSWRCAYAARRVGPPSPL